MTPVDEDALTLAQPAETDLEHINDLILRSKAVWGYDEAFMKACEKELEVTLHLLKAQHVMVASKRGKIIGVVEIWVNGSEGHLEKLFVDPAVLRSGAGRKLFDWAVTKAKGLGADHLMIEADPDAEGFYLKMGATRVGDVPSGSIPGRTLPLLRYTLL